MKAEEVFELIKGERQYQDTIRRQIQNDKKDDKEKSIADFLIYIETHVARAKDELYYVHDEEAMAHIRKIAALAFAALESFETPIKNLEF